MCAVCLSGFKRLYDKSQWACKYSSKRNHGYKKIIHPSKKKFKRNCCLHGPTHQFDHVDTASCKSTNGTDIAASSRRSVLNFRTGSSTCGLRCNGSKDGGDAVVSSDRDSTLNRVSSEFNETTALLRVTSVQRGKHMQGAKCFNTSTSNTVCLDTRGVFLAPAHVFDDHNLNEEKLIMEIFILDTESHKPMLYSSDVRVFCSNSEFDLVLLHTKVSTPFPTSVFPWSCSVNPGMTVRMIGLLPPPDEDQRNLSSFEVPGYISAIQDDGETLFLNISCFQGMSGCPVKDNRNNLIGMVNKKDTRGAYCYAQNITKGSMAYNWLEKNLSRWRSENHFGDDNKRLQSKPSCRHRAFNVGKTNHIRPQPQTVSTVFDGIKKVVPPVAKAIKQFSTISSVVEAANVMEKQVPDLANAVEQIFESFHNLQVQK